MLRSLGDGYAMPLIEALATPPSVSIRANTLKDRTVPDGAALVPWCDNGFYLPSRPLFAADPAWHQGLYYVQDASSMVYSHVVAMISCMLEPQAGHGLRYLDACAAPGGKSTAALEVLPADALVVANEYDRHRANILAENIAKSGAPNVVVTRGDAARFGRMRDAFDIVAVDAPCSGEGMMRKEPEAVRQWSEALVADCAATQRRLLESLWEALRPGGVLIYSTCTFNRLENEEQVDFLVGEYGAESIDLGLDSFGGVFRGFGTDSHCYRFAPGHIDGEGLFVAALRKPGEPTGSVQSQRRQTACQKSGDFISRHLLDASEFVETRIAGTVYAQPAAHAAFIASVGKATDVMRSGVAVATEKGRDLVPTQELALSAALDISSFACVEADYQTAMTYLRGESLQELPEGTPKGFVLLCYGGKPLGFAKNIGRRANNLYPDAMRLRLDPRNLPATPPNPLTQAK